ncbi:MAG TPA: Fe-S oxidoreductase, partial [Burkholderiaceae bacterium]|nr:Fe-S oxidoreductase [Burkholderiaceae bacterium]
KAMAKVDEQGRGPDFISSDCAMAGHHIAQGMAGNQLPAARLAHPLTLVRHAYGLE